MNPRMRTTPNSFSNPSSTGELIGISGCVLLLYFCLSFPNAIPLCIGLLFGVWNILRRKGMSIVFDAPLVWALAFSVSFFALNSYIDYSLTVAIGYCLNIVVMYLVGRNWLEGEFDDIRIEKTLKFIATSITLFIWLCIVYTAIISPGSLVVRQFSSFWDGSLIAATHFSTLSTLPLAVYILSLFRHDKADRRFGFLGTLLIIIANCIMSNRVIFVFTCAIGALCLLLNNDKKSMTPKLMALIVLGLVASALIYFYSNNVFGIQSIFGSIPVFSRMNDLAVAGYKDPRLDRQIYILTHLFDSINGGGFFCNTVGEPHNVFLDIYDYAGWLPAILFLGFCVLLVIRLFVGYRGSRSYSTRLLVVVAVSMLISFFEEPVIRSCECYFVLFFFIVGLSFASFGKSGVSQSLRHNRTRGL